MRVSDRPEICRDSERRSVDITHWTAIRAMAEKTAAATHCVTNNSFSSNGRHPK